MTSRARAVQRGCTCPWGVAHMGTLYRVDMGYGECRLTTDPACPVHACTLPPSKRATP